MMSRMRVTPMRDDGALDLPALRALIDWHVAEGTAAIVIVGTTGESPTVSVDEHQLLIRTAVEHAAGRVPVIAGTGANSTAEAIALTEYAHSVGASAGLSVGITRPLIISTVIEPGMALAIQRWSHCLRKSRRRS